jgi:hypothetical protein
LPVLLSDGAFRNCQAAHRFTSQNFVNLVETPPSIGGAFVSGRDNEVTVVFSLFQGDGHVNAD